MRAISTNSGVLVLSALLVITASGPLSAQPQNSADPNITITGQHTPDASELTKGPEIKGMISLRRNDRIQVTAADGTNTLIVLNDDTKIKASSGLFSNKKLAADSLLNGLPVTVKTLQWSGGLVASQINLRGNDLKMASMIRHGTAQGFADQIAATQALRGRMADLDKYDIKNTTNVNFATGKAALTAQAKDALCAAATTAEGMDNALLLVVGYTDSTGSNEYNQRLSEKRAGSVINFLQQNCHWKPYRMLTPTGMSEADPMASNDTSEGKALNRRVSVNVLVSKAVEGL